MNSFLMKVRNFKKYSFGWWIVISVSFIEAILITLYMIVVSLIKMISYPVLIPIFWILQDRDVVDTLKENLKTYWTLDYWKY